MRGVVVSLGLVLAGVASIAQPSPGAPAGKTRIVDRTLSCTTSVQAGVRKIDLHAQSGVRDGPSAWRWLGSAYLGTPGVTGPGPAQWSLAGLRAGWPPPADPPEPLLDTELWIGVGRCRPVAASVPLSARGLTGGAASPLKDDYTCFPSRGRILVRLRAVFRSPVSLQLNRLFGQLRANGAIRRGELAVRARSGKPLAYAEVLETGKARLFITRSCVGA